MAYSRVTVILLVVLAAVVFTQAKKNDLTVGARVSGDYLIQHETAKKSHQWLQIVKLTKTFTGNNYSNITQVQLLDQNKNGNGATPTILSGGPGAKYVTVQFKSVRGHSIDFIVDIYGK